MKTVLFIDRTKTTHQYAKMTPFMEDVKVIHVAYSNVAVDILKSYKIKPDYVYLNMFREAYDQSEIDLELLNEIDNDIITYSKGRFNLNSSIQSDRGFALLSYEECLKSAIAHYKVWQQIFRDNHIDLMTHEPCSLFFNHLASILCNKQGGTYSYEVATRSDKYEFAYFYANNDDFDYRELRSLYSKYLESPGLIDRERCVVFLNKFRADYKVFFGNILNRKKPFFSLLLDAIKNSLSYKLKTKKTDRIYDNINYWLSYNNVPLNKIKNIISYKIEGVKFLEKIPLNEKYFFYPFHLEPEASVLYLGGGIYKNQVKLIENIAASLPAGYYLYVKDHPHEYAYREAVDYKRLMQIPNLRLLTQTLSAKSIIDKSCGVITLNGTAGFEALLMGKQVYCFGQNLYSFMSRVHRINHIKELQSTIYRNINEFFNDDDNLMAYIMAYLEASHPGYTSWYTGGPMLKNINYDDNARTIAKEMLKYIDFMTESN